MPRGAWLSIPYQPSNRGPQRFMSLINVRAFEALKVFPSAIVLRKSLRYGVPSIRVEPFEKFRVFRFKGLSNPSSCEVIDEEPFAQRRVREANRHREQQILLVQISLGGVPSNKRRTVAPTAPVPFENLVPRDPLKYVEGAIRVVHMLADSAVD